MYSLVSVPAKRDPSRLIHTLYSGPDHLTQGSDFQRIRRILGADLQAQLALTSPWRVFVHAGAVGWGKKAILLPGDNEVGKSTLTAAFIRAGATLFSDEFAVLDRRGLVHPYPLPLRLREEGGARSREVTVEELGGVPAKKPLPVGWILSLRFDSTGRGRLQNLSQGRGAMELLLHATQARSWPHRVMRVAGRAAEGAKVLKGRRGEADEMVRELVSRRVE